MILILGRSPIKWWQCLDMTIVADLDAKPQLKEAFSLNDYPCMTIQGISITEDNQYSEFMLYKIEL